MLKTLQFNIYIYCILFQNAKTQEEKVSKILEFVIMRGPEGYRKFTDVLHATGHTFVADFLREEGILY